MVSNKLYSTAFIPVFMFPYPCWPTVVSHVISKYTSLSMFGQSILASVALTYVLLGGVTVPSRLVSHYVTALVLLYFTVSVCVSVCVSYFVILFLNMRYKVQHKVGTTF